MNVKENLIQDLLSNLDFYLSQDELYLHSETLSLVSLMGIETTQKTYSDAFYMEEQSMVTTLSDSSYVHFASFTIDDNHGKIKEYQGKDKTDLLKKNPKEYDYQTYIQTYGKLCQKKYTVFCQPRKKDEILNELFQEEENEKSMTIQNLFPEDIIPDGIKSIHKKEETYSLSLNPKITHCHLSLSIKNRGKFDSYPDFKEASMDISFRNEKLIIHSLMEYRIRYGFMNLPIRQENTIEIYIGKQKKFLIGDKEIMVSETAPFFSM